MTSLFALVVLGPAALPARAGLNLQPVASGLKGVTSIAHAGDGTGRLFIALQEGLIVIRDPAGEVRPTPFLDIRSIVTYGGERGLLGLAFPKNYPASRRFYVHYVDKGGAVSIARYLVNGPDPNVANPFGEVLLTVPQPYANHKGGQLQFGPDGYLYIGLGDGGGRGDPENNGQNLGTLLGKILRIDVSGGSGYTVPLSNPFRSTAGARPEIWAYGLRNPWRFSFDRAAGDMLIGDVGEYDWEEIDFQPAGVGGRNYGWRRKEGSLCFDPAIGCDASGLTPPVMEYSHDVGCSVTGGYRYRGSGVPGLAGAYLFADYCLGTVWASRPDDTGQWSYAPAVDSSYFISTFGEDEAGEIYVADSRTSGGVYKIVAGTPGLSVGDARVVEGDSGTRDAVFRVMLLPASPTPTTVSYSSVNGTATAGVDYIFAAGTLAFPAGTTSATVAVPVRGDTSHEGDEAFSLVLTNPVGASVVSGRGRGSATIVDDDAEFFMHDTSVPEGGPGTSEAMLTVLRFGAMEETVSVDFATADGSAVAGVDYLATSGTLTFAPGQSSASFSIPLLGDILVEPPTTFRVNFSNPVGGSLSRAFATVTIGNDDTGPSIAADDVSLAEGDSGTSDAVFTVSLSYASTQTVTVSFQTLPGSAGTLDYESASGSLTFGPGVVSQTVTVGVRGDVLNEADETFLLYLSQGVNGMVTRNGTGTILDSDPLPSVSVGSVSILEGDAGLPSASFPLTLSVPSGRYVSVPFVTTSGTAVEGPSPVLPRSGLLTLQSKGASYPYPSTIVVPASAGNVRKVRVTLDLGFNVSRPIIESLDVLLVGPQGQSVVLMSDVPGGFSAGSPTLVFDDDGGALRPEALSSGTFRPTDYDPEGDLDAFDSPAPAGPHGAALSDLQGQSPVGAWRLFVMGDAAEYLGQDTYALWRLEILTDADYVGTAANVVFPPGVTTAFAQVPVIADQRLEPDETFDLDLGPPDYATLVVGHAVGTIRNDDPLNLRIGDLTVAEGNAGATDALFTVALDQPAAGPVTVDYATVDGSATAADGDFAARSGTLTFAPGETRAIVAVPVVGDAWHEADESFSLVLSAPVGAAVLRGVGMAFLPNDDPMPTLVVADALALEGEAAAFRVHLSAPSGQEVTVSYATTSGSALAGADYEATSGVLTLPPYSSEAAILVPLFADPRAESSESFSLSLASPSHAEVLDGMATGWILDPQTLPRLQFSAAQFRAREAAPRAVITVRRTGDSRQPVTVDYRASGGSARAGIDYTPVSGTLSLPRGVLVQTFSVPLSNDALADGPKTVLLDLNRIEGPALMGAPETAVLSIADDDVGGQVRFSQPLFSVNEAGGQATITVARGGGAAGEVSVVYSTSDEGATAGVDYQAASGTLLFGPGATRQTFTVPVLVDAQAEGQERVVLSLTDPSGGAVLGAPSAAALSIADAQPTLEFASATFAAKEGAARAIVTALRSGPLTAAATVSYSTSDGTAVQGIDYVPASGVLTFGPGIASRTFGVDLLDNRIDQEAPTILLGLSSPAGAVLGSQATAVMRIEDDDAAGVVEFGAAGYQAGDQSPAALVTVIRTHGLAQDIAVDYATADGTASAGVDYQATSGRLTFGAGITKQTFSVPLLDPGGPNGDETVLLSLGNPTGGGGLGPRSTASLTILSTDPLVQFGAVAYRAAPGAPSVTIAVARSGPVTAGVTVEYATSDGSAVADQDYVASTGTLSFAPGVKVRTFAVEVLPGGAPENEETVNLTLSNPGGGAAVGRRGAAVLTLPASASVVQWTRSAIRVSERAKTVLLAIERLGPAMSEATVAYATSEGTAQAGSDFTASSGTMTFKPGATRQTLKVPILNDSPDEGDETFAVALSDPGPGVLLGATSAVTVTILDDDRAGTLDLMASDWSVREAGGLATITVIRRGGSASGVTVDYATGGGTAEPGVDYEATSGTLVFGPGEMTRTFAIPIFVVPSPSTGSRSVGLTLGNPGGGGVLGPTFTGRLWIVKP